MGLLFGLTRLLSALVSVLPFPLLYRLSDLVYLLLYHVAGYRKQIVRDNLRHAFPAAGTRELRAIEKSFFRYLCDLNVEILKMPGLTVGEINRRVTFSNGELLRQYAAENRNLVAVTAHFHNWEWGGLALSSQFPEYRVLGVYKPLKNRSFDTWFRKVRARFGMELVPMKSTLRAMLKRNDRPTLTSLLSDQTPTRGETEFVTHFLGRPVPVFLGAEKLARLTGYAVIYLAMRRVKRGYYTVEVIPVENFPAEAEIHQITLAHVRILEEEIRRDPSYWLWSHRRWKHSDVDWPNTVVTR